MLGVLSCLSKKTYNRESTPEANISKTNPRTVMHCGSLSQGFAECLQKETKQVTDAEKAAQGYLPHQVQANATETQGERLKSHPTQTEPERGAAPAVGRHRKTQIRGRTLRTAQAQKNCPTRSQEIH